MQDFALFDRKLPDLATPSLGFVHPSVGTTADEAHDFVPIVDLDFARITAREHFLGVGRF